MAPAVNQLLSCAQRLARSAAPKAHAEGVGRGVQGGRRAPPGCRRLHHGTAFITEPSTAHGFLRRRLARAAPPPAAFAPQASVRATSPPAALRRRLPRTGSPTVLCAAGCIEHGASTLHARAASTPAALRRRLPCAPPHHGALRRRLPRTGSPTVLCAAGFIEHGAASCSTAGAACASCYSGFNSRWMSAAGAGWAQLGLHEATAVRICCVSWWVLCVWGGGVVFTL